MLKLYNQPVILWTPPDGDKVMVSQPFSKIEKRDIDGPVEHNPIVFRTGHLPDKEIGIGGRFVNPPTYQFCVNLLDKSSTYSVGVIDQQQTRVYVANGNTPESSGFRWRFTNEGCPSHHTIRLSMDLAALCYILGNYKCPSFEVGHLIGPDRLVMLPQI